MASDRPRDALKALAEARVALCSACLLGHRTRYDGADKGQPKVARALEGKTVIPICPEVDGGLPVPRPPAELTGGDGAAVLDGRAAVATLDGAAVTDAFRRGCELARQTARRYGATVALLKEGSPSCGTRRVRIDAAAVDAPGVTAAGLVRDGLVVLSDEDLPD